MNKQQVRTELKHRVFGAGFVDGLFGAFNGDDYGKTSRDVRREYQRGYYEGVQKRFANLGLALVTPKRADEDTTHFHAWIVRVFRRDNAYWIVPVTRGESGMPVGRETFLPMPRPPFSLTLQNAYNNASPCDHDESRRVVSEVNQRYGLRLVYEPDARIVKGEAVHA